MEVPTLEDYHRLENKFAATVEAVEILIKAIPRRPWTLDDIADDAGICKSNLYKAHYKHHIPNYGVSDFTVGKPRWKPETVIWWKSIPEEKRIAMRGGGQINDQAAELRIMMSK